MRRIKNFQPFYLKDLKEINNVYLNEEGKFNIEKYIQDGKSKGLRDEYFFNVDEIVPIAEKDYPHTPKQDGWQVFWVHGNGVDVFESNETMPKVIENINKTGHSPLDVLMNSIMKETFRNWRNRYIKK